MPRRLDNVDARGHVSEHAVTPANANSSHTPDGPGSGLRTPPALTTARLCIRAVEERDIAPLMAVNGDDDVTRHLPYPSWQSRADGEAWYARMQSLSAAGAAVQLVIEERDTAHVVGSCVLLRYDAPSARAELGYVLGRSAWGRGYMREALTAVINFAFGDGALRRLEAEVNPDNTASVRVLEHLGFVREGRLRQRWRAKDITYDTYIYGMLTEEWTRHPLWSLRGA